VANMCPPDLDDWIWDDALIKYRKEIWGY